MSSILNIDLDTRSNFHALSLIKILRLKQVINITGLCRSAIYNKAKLGDFPSPIKLGTGRSSGWLEYEVQEWLVKQIQSSRDSSKGESQ